MPKGLQLKTVTQLHKDTHSSMERMAETLKLYTVWDGWKKYVQRAWDNCEACKQLQTSQPEGRFRLDKISLTELEPMSIIHIDLFQFKKKDYLSMRDQVSTFTWFSHLPTTDMSKVLDELDHIQDLFGRITKLVSDQGPQFQTKFTAYCRKKNIQSELSSVYSPSSNSHSELGGQK